MSEQLLHAIQGVQKEIAEHRAYYVKNEAQTKQALIAPILKALGWSEYRSAKSHFHLEFSDGSKKVDYALIQNGRPIVLIEAKKLHDRLGKKTIEQVSHYCFQENVKMAVLTNGSEWRFYSPLLHSIKEFEARCFLVIDVEHEDANQLVVQLSNLSSRHAHGLEEFANHYWLLKTWNSKLNKEELVKRLIKPMRDSLPQELSVPLNDVREFIKTMIPEREKQERNEPPTARAVILDGKHYPIISAFEILLQTAEWLIKLKKLNRDVCPILPGENSKVRYLIHTQPIHQSGTPFKRPKLLTNGLYLDVNYSLKDSVRLAKSLLVRNGYPPTTLQLIGFDD